MIILTEKEEFTTENRLTWALIEEQNTSSSKKANIKIKYNKMNSQKEMRILIKCTENDQH